MAIKTLSTTVEAKNAGRVDLVVRELAGTSRSQVRGMVDHGCVTINNSPCKTTATTVSAGDVVSIRFDPTQRYHEKRKRWDDRTFDIAFEDDHIIVVNKTAGTLTVPTDRNEPNTLVERVTLYLSHSRKKREACLVHRLDRAVSGLLVFGKQEAIGDLLVEQFKLQKPERVYAAIVAGVVKRDEGSFVAHLATGKNMDRFSTKPSEHTEEATTHFRVLKRMSDATLVEASLATGKTRHQIRVHFADAGHPVLGDPRYKTKLAKHPRWIKKRIALHAQSLSFVHPVTGEGMTFESPLPSAMQRFLTKSR